jgi:hypothetical protein
MNTALPNLLEDSEESGVHSTKADKKAEQASVPATQGWVMDTIEESVAGCWARRQLRRYNLWLAFGLGVIFASQILGVIAVRSMIKETAQAAAIDVIRRFGVFPPQPTIVEKPDSLLVPMAHAESSR